MMHRYPTFQKCDVKTKLFFLLSLVLHNFYNFGSVQIKETSAWPTPEGRPVVLGSRFSWLLVSPVMSGDNIF